MSRSAAVPANLPVVVRPDGRAAQQKGNGRGQVNDLDLDSWKNYENIITDSLWMIPERDHTGAHSAGYHGNFIPQIPHQMMLRYTRKGDVVVDPFMGMGTTLIEGRRLGRHVIGLELQESVCESARVRTFQEPNEFGVETLPSCCDSRTLAARLKVANALQALGKQKFQLLVLHPPYHDIIHFSSLENDLSNATDLDTYLKMFSDVVGNFAPLLEKDRYLVLVIGDKYADGEWVPLGSRTMDAVLKHGFSLKSWIVKNMTGNRAKRNLDNLWRYRALRGGFYIFKHEHVLVFRKDR
ncbi:MAG: DNA methylase [Candidatus Riflebacteria bacterium]|nr:DNA methylase [Candidatus Riflebacteria bacterium]